MTRNFAKREAGDRAAKREYHRIIHVGTGIPELTTGLVTNQKILEYHRHVTDMIHERKNDK